MKGDRLEIKELKRQVRNSELSSKYWVSAFLEIADRCFTMWLKQFSAEEATAIKALVEYGTMFHPFEDLTEGDPVLLLNMNDQFAWGTADGEEISPQEAVEVARCVEAVGTLGASLWVARKRGCELQTAIKNHPRYGYDMAKAEFEKWATTEPEPR